MEDLNKLKIERRRGWILKFLNATYPSPLEFLVLQELMDSVNFPMSCRQLVRELDFLRSEDMLRIFPLGASTELDGVAQTKLLQRCSEVEDEANKICIRIRTRGINFNEGNGKCVGVARVI